MRSVWRIPWRSDRVVTGRRVAGAFAAFSVACLVGGCEYGYSRSALEGGGPGVYAAPSGSISVGYQTGWVSPWLVGVSYPYPYAPYWYPHFYYPYDPWWPYLPRYAYSWHPYPHVYAPYVVPPPPRRTFRSNSVTPAPPSTSKKRRLNFP